ncbi:MAG TPA: sigma 54-interacting transcriptional regulator [Victivallales bacterium]|nr:sigma 54-interacting transcriptional regulator [Victivallales bacterium]
MDNFDKTLSEEQSQRELQILYKISRTLDSSLNMEEVLYPILEFLYKYMNMNYGTITILHKKTGEISIESSYGLPPAQAKKIKYKLGEGVTGHVIMTGEPQIIQRKSESPLVLDRTKRGKGADTSFICVPIKVDNEVAGALSVDTPFKDEMSLQKDARFLSVIASMLAQAVKLRRQAQEEQEKLSEENERLRLELKEKFKPDNIIGNSHEMQIVYDQIAKIAKSDSTALIIGETGTGKELVASAIHYNSNRAKKPFVKVHCAALPENIIESELFGHCKGAFTGASSDRKGRFEMAEGGTLFLDEIGEISQIVQVKLLRALQEREIERVGDSTPIKVNIRLIAATNKNLAEMVANGKFREDLYYRLNVFPIYVPPLRMRKADILLLAEHFLKIYAEKQGRKISKISSKVSEILMAYKWPGNVRELENCIERAVLIAEGDTIEAMHLPPALQLATTKFSFQSPNEESDSASLETQVNAFERALIQEALEKNKYNVAATARALKSTPRIISYKINKLGIKYQ